MQGWAINYATIWFVQSRRARSPVIADWKPVVPYVCVKIPSFSCMWGFWSWQRLVCSLMFHRQPWDSGRQRRVRKRIRVILVRVFCLSSKTDLTASVPRSSRQVGMWCQREPSGCTDLSIYVLHEISLTITAVLTSPAWSVVARFYPRMLANVVSDFPPFDWSLSSHHWEMIGPKRLSKFRTSIKVSLPPYRVGRCLVRCG